MALDSCVSIAPGLPSPTRLAKGKLEMTELRTIADPYVDSIKYADSEALQRLFVLAFNQGYTKVAKLPCPECQEWEDEKAAMFNLLADKIDGDPDLLLFLRDTVADDQEVDLKALADEGKVGGYAIVRPDPLGSVAEAVITAPPSTAEHYLTCETSLPLAGLAEGPPVRGLPFMEQDGVVSCCAHASLWMASRLVTARFGAELACSTITSGSVTEATIHQPAILRRKLPTGGLTLQEILMALEASGYSPLSYAFESDAEKNQIDQTIYRYVESGIPVILLLELEEAGHSVVVCGHTFDPDAWWPGAREVYFRSLAAEDQWLPSACWTPQYLILDDNYGPALAMSRGSLRNRCSAAIVPLPREARIFLTAEDAEQVAAGYLFAEAIVEAMEHQLDHNDWSLWASNAQQGTRKFVLRTLLVESASLLTHIHKLTGYSERTREVLSSKAYPERVWMIEVSLPSIYGAKRKLGEILLDPHIPKQFIRGLEPLLVFHLPGFVWDASADAEYVGPELPAPVITTR